MGLYCVCMRARVALSMVVQFLAFLHCDAESSRQLGIRQGIEMASY